MEAQCPDCLRQGKNRRKLMPTTNSITSCAEIHPSYGVTLVVVLARFTENEAYYVRGWHGPAQGAAPTK